MEQATSPRAQPHRFRAERSRAGGRWATGWDWPRLARHGYLLAVGIIGAAYAVGRLGGGIDAHAYWAMSRADPYGAAIGTDDAFLYSPVAALANLPLTLLPWHVYAAGLIVLSMLALYRMAGAWSLPLLLWPAVSSELLMGNIHLLLGLAIVAGVRYPAAWAFLLLTKVTPGVGVLWFAFRREWRSLAIALGATAALALGAFVLVPSWWADWIRVLRESAGSPPAMSIGVPLAVRLPFALAAVWYGARTDRPALLAVAGYLALPSLWGHSGALLLAAIPLDRVGERHRLDRARARLAADGRVEHQDLDHLVGHPG